MKKKNQRLESLTDLSKMQRWIALMNYICIFQTARTLHRSIVWM